MVTSLPMTVSARRNARLRALALAAIPFVLFTVAAVPRVWAPDLVPFGERQAVYVSEAFRHAPVSLLTFYLDPSVPLLAPLDPLLWDLPWPIETWVVLRGLADALGVSMLYLAARSLVGVWPALLAGVLYAANPLAWAAVRDPSGALGAVVASAILLAAARFVRRRSIVRAVAVGAMLLLIGVPAALRTEFDPHDAVPSLVDLVIPSLRTSLYALVPFVLALPFLSTRVWPRWGSVAATVLVCLVVIGAVARPDRGNNADRPFTMLWEWRALESAVRETAGRTGVPEIIVRDEAPTAFLAGPLQALLRRDVSVRKVWALSLLPLEREAIFVLYPPDGPLSEELQRASSLTIVAAPDGLDTGARIATLRPRAAVDWLARAERIDGGTFADGSRLLGVRAQPDRDGGLVVALYWQLPSAPAPAQGNRFVVGVAGAPTGDAMGIVLPPPDAGRRGEIVVLAARLGSGTSGRSGSVLQVTLFDDAGTIVRTVAGGVVLDVPLGSPPQ